MQQMLERVDFELPETLQAEARNRGVTRNSAMIISQPKLPSRYAVATTRAGGRIARVALRANAAPAH